MWTHIKKKNHSLNQQTSPKFCFWTFFGPYYYFGPRKVEGPIIYHIKALHFCNCMVSKRWLHTKAPFFLCCYRHCNMQTIYRQSRRAFTRTFYTPQSDVILRVVKTKKNHVCFDEFLVNMNNTVVLTVFRNKENINYVRVSIFGFLFIYYVYYFMTFVYI